MSGAGGGRARVELANRQRRVPLPRAWIRGAVGAALAQAGVRRGLSVVYVDNPTLRDLNARFHAADRLTDVLAFPLGDMPEGEPGGMLGEVIVSADRAEQEARWRGLPRDRELVLYAVHGTLHLLGYDDHDPAGRKRMRAAERAALAAGRPGGREAPGVRSGGARGKRNHRGTETPRARSAAAGSAR